MSASVVPATPATGPQIHQAAYPLRPAKSRRWSPAQLSRPLRFLVGVLVALGHALVIAATVVFARLHVVLLASPQMRHDLTQLDNRLLDFFPIVQGVCYAAAVAHAMALVHTMRSVFRFLVMAPRKVFSTRSRRRSSVVRSKLASTGPTVAATRPPPWYVHMWGRLDRFLATYPIEIGQVRQLVEIALQTFQAHKMSSLVATVWLNRLLACVIVANCWFTPLVFVTMRHHTLYLARVVRLTIDTALDAVYSFGIPMVILYPYWRDYVPALGSFPYDFYALDTWAIVAAAETRQVFISSWLDLLSKTLPWFFFCYRLQSVRRLVALRAARVSPPTNRACSRLSRVLNLWLIVWGVAVALLHLRVTWVGESLVVRGCLIEMRPWLSTSYTCTVMELSCSQRRITGQPDEIAHALTETDMAKIQGLIISHCSQLEMPSMVRSLSSITLVKFYNSTILNWPVAAALTNKTNPVVQQFFAIRTSFTPFPPGLLVVDLPRTLRDVKFIATNLATLPTQFSETWRSTLYLAMDLNPLLREVPEAVARLPQLMFLTMDSNAIEFIPDTLLQNIPAIQMRFINNPISKIPVFVGRPGVTLSIVLAYTNVSELPAPWLATKDDTTRGMFSIDAEHTPLCESLRRQHPGDSEPTEYWIGRFRVICTDIYNYYANVSYPIENEDLMRQANRATS